ncbi:JmjC domain-containing protein [Aphelenchoides fujianensis]|nr:JmjC domain-containing protein [Aphelenchoides fujianensis]
MAAALAEEFRSLLAEVFAFEADGVRVDATKQSLVHEHLGGFWMTDALLNCLRVLVAEERSEARVGVEHLHEQVNVLLNTGHYSEVEDRHRLLYAVVCLEALRVCDKGLLLGLDVEGDVLACGADLLCAALGPEEPIEFHDPPLQREPTALPNSVRIPVVHLPSLESFYRQFFEPQRPVIIRGLVDQWPAFGNFPHLYARCSRRTVPIELGGSYVDAEFHQQLMTFGEYLREFIAPAQARPLASFSILSPEQSAYLAQHRLLDQIPSLRQEILVPDYCALASGEEGAEGKAELINCFIGPATTVSPLHSDPRHNFFCQVEGRKFVRLIDPKFSDRIYLHDDFLRANSSRVDVERPDWAEFPLFREVVCEDFEMEAGDCLFIPRRYLHYVRALRPSISISIWFG